MNEQEYIRNAIANDVPPNEIHMSLRHRDELCKAKGCRNLRELVPDKTQPSQCTYYKGTYKDADGNTHRRVKCSWFPLVFATHGLCSSCHQKRLATEAFEAIEKKHLHHALHERILNQAKGVKL